MPVDVDLTKPRPQAPLTSLMLKPVGTACNQACAYCYARTPVEPRQLLAPVLLEPTLDWFLAQAGLQPCITWQGGEPLLAGLPHFAHTVDYIQRASRPAQRVGLAVQTNGSLLDDESCRFFATAKILVGLSLDGPAEGHDPLRSGDGNHERILDALARLRAHGLEPNILCTLHRDNVADPDRLWHFFESHQLRWLQLIPIVEWADSPSVERPGAPLAPALAAPVEPRLAAFVAPAEAIGEMWCRIFDLWFTTARHRLSIRLFDAVLNRLVLGQTSECTLAPRCTGQATLFPGGELFACDHFVGPAWKIGSVSDSSVSLDAAGVDAFAERKRPGPTCEACTFVDLCHGGCPKHRPQPDAPSYLCPAYQRFFAHAGDRLAWLATQLRRHLARLQEANS